MFCLTLSGYGDGGSYPPPVAVSGKVVLNEKPLTGGTSHFVPADPAKTLPGSSPVKSDGSFKVTTTKPDVHVLADAATSVLAIIALLGGKFWNWAWLDPLMGIVGAVLVGVWSIGLIRATSRVLLDREMDHDLVAAIREAIESDGQSHVSDLHLWRVGRSHFACIVAVVSREPRTADDYREQLRAHEQLVHVTVEVQQAE